MHAAALMHDLIAVAITKHQSNGANSMYEIYFAINLGENKHIIYTGLFLCRLDRKGQTELAP
jgi:hypothetical protein